MCGICGRVSFAERVDSGALEAAAHALAHRGPDGLETWMTTNCDAGLAHSRLAIIDIPGGRQPMLSSDSRFAIVFNGEIYNYRLLREQLTSLGHIFRTQSDTEVLLAAFTQWGKECLLKLNGMFAFAVYDSREKRLFLARDRTGIKPLYYSVRPNQITFGSELKSVLSWPQTQASVDYQALADFLQLSYPIGPATGFRECTELQPGTFLYFSTNGVEIGRYWSWKREEAPWNRDECLCRLEQELMVATREHTVSDVPIGAFLSGGIDSSLLVAFLARTLGPNLQTFNVKFGERAYDESAFARSVAASIGTQHHQITVDGPTADLDLVQRVLDQFDQPYADSSAIPTYLLCQEIRKHVKVVISGDGGDEMFGGYHRYPYADFARLLGAAPTRMLGWMRTTTDAIPGIPVTLRRQAHRMLSAAAARGHDRLMSISSYISLEELGSVITPDFADAMGEYRGFFPANGYRNPGGPEMIDATVVSTLPGDYLKKVDIASSAHGLEVRVPMLSNRILELSESLPLRYSYSWTKNKILLRSLAKRHLPPEVVGKPKQGFGIPLDSWLGDSGRREVSSILNRPAARIRNFIRPSYSAPLLKGFSDQSWDHSRWSRFGLYQRVYALWSLERWLQRWRPAQ